MGQNLELLLQAQRMLEDRARYWEKDGDVTRASAYESATAIVRYAILGDKQALDQFDTYHDRSI